MITVAEYGDNLPIKKIKKILFSILAKKTQSILFLDNYSSTTTRMKKMSSCLKNQLEKTTGAHQ